MTVCCCVGVLGCWCVCELVCWCVGALARWCVGVLVCRCVGVLVVCWCVGVLVRWRVGVLVCWWCCVGVLVCWCVGLLVCWCAGVLVCWCLRGAPSAVHSRISLCTSPLARLRNHVQTPGTSFFVHYFQPPETSLLAALQCCALRYALDPRLAPSTIHQPPTTNLQTPTSKHQPPNTRHHHQQPPTSKHHHHYHHHCHSALLYCPFLGLVWLRTYGRQHGSILSFTIQLLTKVVARTSRIA